VTAAVAITEAEWQAQVVELAHLLGWQHLHVRRSIGKGRSWQTTTNIVGWPDLFLWHPQHGFAAIELKSERGVVADEQIALLASLEAAGARTLLARPSDVDAVRRLLQGQRK
jgi:hypothetical protein